MISFLLKVSSTNYLLNFPFVSFIFLHFLQLFKKDQTWKQGFSWYFLVLLQTIATKSGLHLATQVQKSYIHAQFLWIYSPNQPVVPWKR